MLFVMPGNLIISQMLKPTGGVTKHFEHQSAADWLHKDIYTMTRINVNLLTQKKRNVRRNNERIGLLKALGKLVKKSFDSKIECFCCAAVYRNCFLLNPATELTHARKSAIISNLI